jgi:hypothetical protein
MKTQNSTLFLDVLDALPLAPQILFPQRYLVVGCRDGEHVAAQRPTYAPNYSLEGQDLAAPVVLAVSGVRKMEAAGMI